MVPTMPSPEQRPKPRAEHEPSEALSNDLAVGDCVAYSKSFLQSIGAFTGDLPHARGEITKMVPLGETMLAEISWDRAGIPVRVNVKNLCRIGSRAFHD